jgi:hypothetical protein
MCCDHMRMQKVHEFKMCVNKYSLITHSDLKIQIIFLYNFYVLKTELLSVFKAEN